MTKTTAVLSVFLFASPSLADPALITPTPKEMSLSGATVSLADATILLTSTNARFRVAAEEINHRLTEELGVQALPVKTGGIEAVRAAPGPVIVVGRSGRGTMRDIEKVYSVQVPAKPEGYGIATHHRHGRCVCVLSGRDEQGALYAAVTLRFLIDPAGSTIANGTATLHTAKVRDWPDFRWREIGSVPAPYGLESWRLRSELRKGNLEKAEQAGQRYAKRVKEYIDFLFRHKINMSEPHSTRFVEVPETRKYARMINDYARARGVDFVVQGSTNIGSYPRHKDDPRITRCIDYRTHKRYFCWSLLDEHEKKIRGYAKAMKEAGFRWLYIHDVDGGGSENPALWNNRCEHCRKMYGDDHAKANAKIFGMYCRIIREAVPDFRMIAVVYPYTGTSLNTDHIERLIVHRSGPIPNARQLALRIANRNRSMVTRLGQVLDPAVKICQRETSPESYALMTEAYGARDFQMYMEFIGSRQRWMPEFSMAAGWAKTYLRPGHEDVFFPRHGRWGYNFLSEILAAEFGWNVNAPGSAVYPGSGVRLRGIDHHMEPREVAVKYLARLCADFWGPEVGPPMVPVFDSNISYRFIQRPDVVAGEMRLADSLGRMKQMARATKQAMEAMEQARAAYDRAVAEGRQPIAFAPAHRFFGDYYRAVLAARCVAAFRLAMMEARPAVIEGRMDQANERIASMRELIAREKAAWQERWPWMRKVPCHRGLNPNWIYTFAKFSTFDYSILEGELEAFDQKKDALFEAYNVPKWFKQALSQRVLYAVPAATAPVIDGRLTEDAWRAAPKNEYFVNHKTSTLAAKETFAWMLYDSSALYLGYTAYEPGADRIKLKKLERDYTHREHCVEFFADVNCDKESYVQWMWDIAGNTYDGRSARNSVGVLRFDPKALTSNAEIAVTSYPDRWTLEARLPAAELGAKPRAGRVWRGNLCRNLTGADGKVESVSTVILSGSRFHTPAKFAEIRFLARTPPERTPVVDLAIAPKQAGQITIGTGVGYQAVFDLSVETTKPLHDATLAAEVYCGDARKGALNAFEHQSVPLGWRTREPFRFLVDTPEPGLEFAFTLKAKEGEWLFRRVFGAPPLRTIQPRYVEGVSGRALAGTAHFPASLGHTRIFDSRSGALEMWVDVRQPLDPPLRFGRDQVYAFFHQGPVRFDHPHLDNHRSLCLKRHRRSLTARVSTAAWQQLWTSASLPSGIAAGWHHIAVQWSAVDGAGLALDVYLDGKKVSGEVRSRLHDKVWRKKSEDFAVQLGSMITGASSLGWAIDEVRISSEPRYAQRFAPGRRPVMDEKTTVIFRFDGNLHGETAGGAKVIAIAGPAR